MPRWNEQLLRIRRYKERLERMAAGQSYLFDPDELHDDAYAFFQCCYHLKDWLKNDPEFTARSGNEIEEYVTNTPALSLCADLCNGLKHLRRDRARSSTPPALAGQHTLIDYGDDPLALGKDPRFPRITIRTYIRYGDEHLSALEIATAALEAWETFLSSGSERNDGAA